MIEEALGSNGWIHARKLAGPNPNWPGRRVYCLGSFERLFHGPPDDDWCKNYMRRLRDEAEYFGRWTVEIKDEHVYLVSPS